MTKWERFELGWRWFWCGLVIGLAPTVYRAQASAWTTLWCCFGWTLMYLPSWTSAIAVRLRRRQSPPTAS